MPRPRLYRLTMSLAVVLNLVGGALAAQPETLSPLPSDLAAQFPAIGRYGPEAFGPQQGCTATLIAPDLILTAAHCVSPSGQSENVFFAGWSQGSAVATRKSQQELRHPAYALDGVHRARNDVALVVLDSPIADIQPIPLAQIAEGALAGTDAALLGYANATPEALSGHLKCPLTDAGVGLIHVGCAVVNGNSGAPLLQSSPEGEWQVVGVISSSVATGALAVELLSWLRQEAQAR